MLRELPAPRPRRPYLRAYAVTSLPGRPGFHRVRTPQVDPAQLAAVVQATAGLRRDPAELLAEQAPGLRAVPETPEDAA